MNISKLNTIKFCNLQNNYVRKNREYSSSPKTTSFKGVTEAASNVYYPIGIHSKEQTAKKIWKLIEQAQNIVICSHPFPDSDAINSGIILTKAIKQQLPNKEVTFYVPGGYPSFLKEIPGIEKVTTTAPKGDIDLAIAVDCSEDYINDKGLCKKAPKHVRIDHHKTNLGMNDISLVNPKMASTTTMLYQELFKPLHIEITPKIAENILSGIITDTAQYKFCHNGDLSIATTQELLDKYTDDPNVSVERIKNKFSKNTVFSDELKNLIENLFDERHIKSISTEQGKKVNIIVLTQRKLRRFKVKDSLPDIKSELSCNINSIRKPSDINILFWDLGKEGGIKVDLRSKEADLCKLAQEFGGGGHAHSAGFTIKAPLRKVVKKVISTMKAYKF